MQLSLVLRLAAVALLVVWLVQLFMITTDEFTTDDGKPMSTVQKIVKMIQIIRYDEGRFLRPDMPVSTIPIVVPYGSRPNEVVNVRAPERAGVFLFMAATAAGLVLMLIGWAIGLLPRLLMLVILGFIGFFAGMYYLNLRPVIPLFMKMRDAAAYVILFKAIFALALAFAAGLFFAFARRAARQPTPT
jgi:hypothetical protein